MQNRLCTRAAVCGLIAVGAAGILGIASGQDMGDAQSKIVRVMAATDFLQTGPGTQAMLPTGNTMTLVQLHGVPMQGLGEIGNTDTIMLREKDAIFPSDDATPDATVVTVPITLEALSMQGSLTGPTGAACTVTLTLAPSPASTGELHLKVTSPNGGTYTSMITVWVTGVFSPGPPTCYGPIPPTKCVLRQKGGGGAKTRCRASS